MQALGNKEKKKNNEKQNNLENGIHKFEKIDIFRVFFAYFISKNSVKKIKIWKN